MNTTPAPQPRTPWWIPLGVVCLVVTFFGWLWWPRDIPPPDVSDFLFEPLDLPEDQNAYALLTKAATSLPEREWIEDDDSAFHPMLQGEAWDDHIAQTTRTDLDAVWPILQQALQTPQSQTPWTSKLSDIIPEPGQIRVLAQLIQLRSMDHVRAGNIDDGLFIATQNLAIGKTMEESRGVIIHFLSGAALRGIGLNSIRTIIAEQSPSTDALRVALQAVSNSRSRPEALAMAFHSELRVFEDGLRMLTRSSRENLFDDDLPPWVGIAPRSLVLMPNLTRSNYVEFMRSAVSAIDAPLPAQKSLVRNDEFEKRINSRWSPVNKLGHVYLGIITPSTNALLTHRLRTQSAISAHEAWIACHLYQRDHGEFPATLDALVPDYLPAVPRDYIDGEPIRYSRDLGVIWSIGDKNLQITTPDQVVEERETVLRLTSDVARASRP